MAHFTEQKIPSLASVAKWSALAAIVILCLLKLLDLFFIPIDETSQLIIALLVVCAFLSTILIYWSYRRGIGEDRAYVPAKLESIRELKQEEVEKCLAFLGQTKLACLELELIDAQTGVYDSKVGGTPYLPPGFDYPYNLRAGSEGKPLRLLCQLNFEQLPQLEGFPQKGILQFYLSCEEDEDTYGMDFDDCSKQEAWRVVYHEDIITDDSALASPPVFEDLDEDEMSFFPVTGEFAIRAKQTFMPITVGDYRWQYFWDNVFAPSPLGKQLLAECGELDIIDALENEFDGGGSRLGGYPDFRQEDPRYGTNEATVLLLQLDSIAAGNSEIMWGDAGVANFFISPKALRSCDFSEVWYNWDCC
jgi:uncharacterized protein YwqG